jgi:DNA-binding response OmpR family regulator
MNSTVLVVDDDDELRKTLVDYLTAEGLAVVEAEHGLQALLQVKRLRPPVVVIDLMMPRLGGLDALKRIRAFSPETTVIVITGVGSTELRRQALDLGATTVLVKPFALPDLLAAIPAVERDPRGRTATADTSGPRAARVLIVDDEADVRETLTDLLAADGYEICTAVDGAAALKCLLEQRPDLVLLDIDMPRLRGVEALVAIREISPDTKVIMMSGKADLDEAKRSLASGAFDYVTKPFDIPYLDQAIRTAILGVG